MPIPWFATPRRLLRDLRHGSLYFLAAGRISKWTGFVAGPWSGRIRGSQTLWQRSRRVALALLLLGSPACSELAQPSQAASPPPTQPPYVSLAAQYLLSAFKDRSAYGGFEISGLRWVASLKGWAWLACAHFQDHGHLRTYAIFIQDNAVVDGRYAVETDTCETQTYTPFDLVTGQLGRPTAPVQPPLY